MSNQCGNCNFDNQQDATFCTQCGGKLGSYIQCDNCHSSNIVDSSYCSHCGKSLTVEPARVNLGSKSPIAENAVDHDVPPKPHVKEARWQPQFGFQSKNDASTTETKQNTKEQKPSHNSTKPSTKPSTKNKGKISLYWRAFKKMRNERKKAKDGQFAFQGEVRGFKERTEQGPKSSKTDNIIVWGFRLERYVDGQRVPPIPVEMRGERFSGIINEGDIVKLLENNLRGEIHSTNQVFNVTSNSKVTVGGKGVSFGYALNMAFGLVILVFVVVVAFYMSQ